MTAAATQDVITYSPTNVDSVAAVSVLHNSQASPIGNYATDLARPVPQERVASKQAQLRDKDLGLLGCTTQPVTPSDLIQQPLRCISRNTLFGNSASEQVPSSEPLFAVDVGQPVCDLTIDPVLAITDGDDFSSSTLVEKENCMMDLDESLDIDYCDEDWVTDREGRGRWITASSPDHDLERYHHHFSGPEFSSVRKMLEALRDMQCDVDDEPTPAVPVPMTPPILGGNFSHKPYSLAQYPQLGINVPRCPGTKCT